MAIDPRRHKRIRVSEPANRGVDIEQEADRASPPLGSSCPRRPRAWAFAALLPRRGGCAVAGRPFLFLPIRGGVVEKWNLCALPTIWCQRRGEPPKGWSSLAVLQLVPQLVLQLASPHVARDRSLPVGIASQNRYDLPLIPRPTISDGLGNRPDADNEMDQILWGRTAAKTRRQPG